jgi:hypothetical protein
VGRKKREVGGRLKRGGERNRKEREGEVRIRKEELRER